MASLQVVEAMSAGWDVFQIAEIPWNSSLIAECFHLSLVAAALAPWVEAALLTSAVELAVGRVVVPWVELGVEPQRVELLPEILTVQMMVL